MPTIPSEPPETTVPAAAGRESAAPQLPHQVRQIAESFGSDAERYDRTRPRYPEALIDRVVAASRGPDVLDVGCGTGISARQFQAAGCKVLGVEPDARMAEFAARRDLDVEIATIEDWDPAGRTFDAVISGQAWHWVDPVAGPAKAAQVLRPGGQLALFWNVFEPPEDIAAAFGEVYRREFPGSPNFQRFAPGLSTYSPILTTTADGIRASGSFREPEQWRFDWDRSYTRAEWLDQTPTFGGHTRLSPPDLAKLLSGLGDAIDAAGGSFTMRYVTIAVTATRRETA